MKYSIGEEIPYRANYLYYTLAFDKYGHPTVFDFFGKST